MYEKLWITYPRFLSDHKIFNYNITKNSLKTRKFYTSINNTNSQYTLKILPFLENNDIMTV